MAEHQIFRKPPSDFDMTIQAAACYCEYEDKLLFLRRPPGGYNGNTWGIPGGKLEKGESSRQAAVRELYEEVGFCIEDDALVEVGIFYIKIPKLDYVFHTFRKRFMEKPSVVLALEEHLEARWVTFEEALQLPLIRGGREVLMHYKKHIER